MFEIAGASFYEIREGYSSLIVPPLEASLGRPLPYGGVGRLQISLDRILRRVVARVVSLGP